MRRIAHITRRRAGRCNTVERYSFTRILIFIAIVLSALAATAQQRGLRQQPNCMPACHIRPQDEIWLISTRHLPCDGNGCENTWGAPGLSYARFLPDRGWVPSSARSFFQGQDPNIVTTVYVHGNRITADWAKDHGLTAYCRLTCGPDRRAIRHVIWSWPSDPIPCGARIVKDARVKGERTTAQSYYLGWWLCQFSPQQRVSLMGFSYGGRTILGALHLMAGGRARGCCLGGNGSRRIHPRMAILACASEGSWLCPGGRNERALLQIDRGLVIFNPNDPALQRYPRLIPGSSGPALGFAGMPRCANGAHKIQQVNAGGVIGKVHRFRAYMDVGTLVAQIRNMVLWPNVGSTANLQVDATRNQSAQVPVDLLPTFDLVAESKLQNERVNNTANTTELVCESPVSELPTFDLAETFGPQQPVFEQATVPTGQLR